MCEPGARGKEDGKQDCRSRQVAEQANHKAPGRKDVLTRHAGFDTAWPQTNRRTGPSQDGTQQSSKVD